MNNSLFSRPLTKTPPGTSALAPMHARLVSISIEQNAGSARNWSYPGGLPPHPRSFPPALALRARAPSSPTGAATLSPSFELLAFEALRVRWSGDELASAEPDAEPEWADPVVCWLVLSAVPPPAPCA